MQLLVTDEATVQWQRSTLSTKPALIPGYIIHSTTLMSALREKITFYRGMKVRFLDVVLTCLKVQFEFGEGET